MSYFLRLSVAAVLGALLTACSADDVEPQPVKNELPLIAYHHGDTVNIRRHAIGELTQIIYSFLHLSDNELSIDDGQQRADIVNLVSLKKDYPDLKILVALGGWGGCETCSDVFSTAAGREEFAASVKTIMTDYDLDGLDLDWEYPAIEGHPGHAYRAEDRENFTALVVRLREVLGSRYELSFAAGASKKFFDNSVEWSKVMPLVDRVNLMTYDLVSGDSTVTGHHTPLLSTVSQSISTDSAVRHLTGLGVEPEKIVIGAAFYARVWEGVEAEGDDVLYRSATFKDYTGFRNYDAYFDDSFAMRWDSDAKAAYAYSATKNMFATFDDRRSVALKTQYAIDNELGGIMFWQLAEDTYEDGLLAAIAAARAGRNDTAAE